MKNKGNENDNEDGNENENEDDNENENKASFYARKNGALCPP